MKDFVQAGSVLCSTLNPNVLQKLQTSTGGRVSPVKKRAIPRVGEEVERSGPVRIIPVPKEAA